MKKQSIHDKFFKAIFSPEENARELLKLQLPPKVMKQIRLKHLTNEKTEQVDGFLNARFADLIFSCPMAQQGKLFFLLEHKSYRDRDIPFQLLDYITGLWEECKKQNRPYIPVVSILFYHGKKKWEKVKLQDHFGSWELKEWIPQFNYVFLDLNVITEEMIHKRLSKQSVAKTAILLLKCLNKSEKLLENLEFILKTGKFKNRQGKDFLQEIVTYLLEVIGKKNQNILIEILIKVFRKRKGEIMTIADSLRQEGLQEGLQKGLQKGLVEGKQDTLIRLLEKKFGLLRTKKTYILSCRDINKLDAAIMAFADTKDKKEILNLLK